MITVKFAFFDYGPTRTLFVVNISCNILQYNMNNVIYCMYSIYTVWAFCLISKDTSVPIFWQGTSYQMSKQDH